MDPLDALADPALRESLLFVRSRAEAVTADEAAEAAGIHRNVARGRLERLVKAGLVEPGFERRSGRSGPGAGRPAKTYAAAPSVAAVEFPERSYETLIGLLADALPQRGRRRRLHEVGAAFGRGLAAELGASATRARGAEQACAMLRARGFHADVAAAGDDEIELVVATCPLRELVRSVPQAVPLDRGMWAGLVGAALGGEAEPLCQTRDCLGEHTPCRVIVRFDSPKRSRKEGT